MDKNGQNRGGIRVPGPGKKIGRPSLDKYDNSPKHNKSFYITDEENELLRGHLATYRNTKKQERLSIIGELTQEEKKILETVLEIYRCSNLSNDKIRTQQANLLTRMVRYEKEFNIPDTPLPRKEQTDDEIEDLPESAASLKTLRSGVNCFITGGAGTGKTSLLIRYRKWCKENGKKFLMLAPTGLAAYNINGRTIHSVFNLDRKVLNLRDYDKDYINKQYNFLKKDIEQYDVIAIDEISMCRADIFSVIVKVVNILCDKPIQWVVCGDFAQLPPVITHKDKSDFMKYYPYCHFPDCETPYHCKNKDHYAGWAFNTGAWKSLNFEFIVLKKIVRQDDPEFCRALNKIRRGDHSGLNYINKNRAQKRSNNTIIVCTTQKQVDGYNNRHIKNLINTTDKSKYSVRTYKHIDFGNKKNHPLRLVPKTRVMFTANNNKEGYLNGLMGKVLDAVEKDSPDNPFDEDMVVVETDEGHIVKVKELSIKLGDKEYVKQIPLQYACAITIHKSQGQTYDNITVDIPYTFAPGQLYVALSRAKSVKNIFIKQPLIPEHVQVDPSVKKYYDENNLWD